MRRRLLLAVAAALAAAPRLELEGSSLDAQASNAHEQAPSVDANAANEVVVFAAVSLSEALRAIGDDYRSRGGQPLLFSFGGSGELARQLRAGAPAQLFVSADAARVDELEKAGLVRPADRVELLSNRLVVVVPSSSAVTVRRAMDLATLSRLALADPASVPAGAYARQWLERAGAWEAVRGRVVPTLDVRAALAAVESGNADAAIVYATDATVSRRARVALAVPASEAPRIAYVAALVAGAGSEARSFFAYLRSPGAAAVFRRFGFEPPPAS